MSGADGWSGAGSGRCSSHTHGWPLIKATGSARCSHCRGPWQPKPARAARAKGQRDRRTQLRRTDTNGRDDPRLRASAATPESSASALTLATGAHHGSAAGGCFATAVGSPPDARHAVVLPHPRAAADQRSHLWKGGGAAGKQPSPLARSALQGGTYVARRRASTPRRGRYVRRAAGQIRALHQCCPVAAAGPRGTPPALSACCTRPDGGPLGWQRPHAVRPPRWGRPPRKAARLNAGRRATAVGGGGDKRLARCEPRTPLDTTGSAGRAGRAHRWRQRLIRACPIVDI